MAGDRRCPKCDDLVVVESEDPLEEYCISPSCDYYRADMADGTLREFGTIPDSSTAGTGGESP